MHTEITTGEAIGRTLRYIAWDDATLILCFTDNTFTTFQAYPYDSDTEDAPYVAPAHLRPLHFCERELLTTGIITGDELKRLKNERAEKWRLQIEERERATYERLRAKYG